MSSLMVQVLQASALATTFLNSFSASAHSLFEQEFCPEFYQSAHTQNRALYFSIGIRVNLRAITDGHPDEEGLYDLLRRLTPQARGFLKYDPPSLLFNFM